MLADFGDDRTARRVTDRHDHARPDATTIGWSTRTSPSATNGCQCSTTCRSIACCAASGCPGDEWSHRSQIDVLPQELGRRREPERRRLDVGRDVVKAGVAQELRQGVGVVHREHRSDESAQVGVDVLDDGLFHELERRLDGTRCVDDHPAAGGEYAVHLGQRCRSVFHEHQTHLTQDDVRGIVGPRQCHRVAHVPVDVGTCRHRRSTSLRRSCRARRRCPSPNQSVRPVPPRGGR